MEWYKKSTKNASSLSLESVQNKLGFCYLTGKGVPKDCKEAVKWFKKSAKGFFGVLAKSRLGDCYYYGEGVKQDYKEAIKWYKKAMEGGTKHIKYAQRALGDCYYNGHGVQQDYKEAVKWYKKSSEPSNNPIAQARLETAIIMEMV